MSHVPIYEQIYQEWSRNPTVNQSELCRQKKVKVGSYMAWKGKTKDKKMSVQVPQGKAKTVETITINVPINQIVSIIQAGKDLVVSRPQLLKNLTDEQKDAVALALGKLQIIVDEKPQVSDGNGYSSSNGEMRLKT